MINIISIGVLTTMLILSVMNSAQGYDLKAKVTYVYDGDTIKVKPEGKSEFKVRFALIDTPESGEYGFSDAKNYVKSKCYGQTAKLTYDTPKYDKYGRAIMMVNCQDILMNKRLVEKGLADISEFYLRQVI